MKQIFVLLLAVSLACAFSACGGAGIQSDSASSQAFQEEPQTGSESPTDERNIPTGNEEENVLVAYFSATGNTEKIANHIQTILDADLYEIVPDVPYTSEDLNYSNSTCRANQEQNDPSARPAIASTLENPEDYDVVFLGYPIWWGQAPKIISTFLGSYDFGESTIVPFCTSGSSGIGTSADDLHALAPEARWMEGQRFSSTAEEATVFAWLEGLELTGTSGIVE